MEKHVNCTKCSKQFKVTNELEHPPVDAAEMSITVECPECGEKHIVKWPDEAEYMVVP